MQARHLQLDYEQGEAHLEMNNSLCDPHEILACSSQTHKHGGTHPPTC